MEPTGSANVRKAPDRNWILHAPSCSLDSTPFPLLAPFHQPRLPSLTGGTGASVAERISSVNELNTKISERYRRLHCASFTSRATRLVDESFGFIDCELTDHGDRMKSGGADEVQVREMDTQTASLAMESEDCSGPSRKTSVSSLPAHSQFILRCASDDGEICAVYEKRRASVSLPLSHQSADDKTLRTSGQRPRPAVSFDDRIVVVDRSRPSSSTGGGQSDQRESLCQRVARCVTRARKTNSIQSGRTAEGVLKTNPLFNCQQDYPTRPFQYAYYYCDPGRDRYLQPDPSLRYEAPPVCSKADQRMARRTERDQLRTNKFGLAVTLMVLVLVLAGVGIGLTIYLD